MQGRQVPLDYTWTRSLIYVDDLLLVGETTKNTTVYSYLQGYFHVEACDYTLKGARCPLSPKETTTS